MTGGDIGDDGLRLLRTVDGEQECAVVAPLECTDMGAELVSYRYWSGAIEWMEIHWL